MRGLIRNTVKTMKASGMKVVGTYIRIKVLLAVLTAKFECELRIYAYLLVLCVMSLYLGLS